MSAVLAFGQRMSNPEIMQMIQRSAEFQQKVGITNPDLIFPGQALTYSFTDGTTETITVEYGDNQWKIVRDKLGKLQQKHGPVVDPVKPQPPVEKPEKKSFPWWLVLATLAFFIIVYFVALELTKWSNQRLAGRKIVDPTTAGNPMVPGGVNSVSDAERHFRELHPGQNVLVKDIKPGFLSTPQGKTARIGFANGTHQNLAFRNTPGFKGKVSTDNGLTWTKEYFLQACGNSARARNSFLTGIIFSESPINFGEEGGQSSAPVAPVKAITEVVSESIKPEVAPTPKPQGPVGESDMATVNSDHAAVMEQFLQTQVAHKGTIVSESWPDGHFKVESTFETKNQPVKKDADKEKE